MPPIRSSSATVRSTSTPEGSRSPRGARQLELLQRGPREEQPLLADVAEPHHRLGLVALTDHVGDHPFAELVVPDVVADAQPELFGTVPAGRLRSLPDRGVDDGLPVTAETSVG